MIEPLPSSRWCARSKCARALRFGLAASLGLVTAAPSVSAQSTADLAPPVTAFDAGALAPNRAPNTVTQPEAPTAIPLTAADPNAPVIAPPITTARLPSSTQLDSSAFAARKLQLEVSAPERVAVGQAFTLAATLDHEPPAQRVRFELVAAGSPPIRVEADASGRAKVSLPNAVTYQLTAAIELDRRLKTSAERVQSAPRNISALALRLSGPAQVFVGEAARVEATLVSDRASALQTVRYALRSGERTREVTGEAAMSWSDLEAGEYTLRASTPLDDGVSLSAELKFSVQPLELAALVPEAPWREDEPALLGMRTNVDANRIEQSGFIVENLATNTRSPLAAQNGSARALLERGDYRVRATLTFLGQLHTSPPVAFTVLERGVAWTKLWPALLAAAAAIAAIGVGRSQLRRRQRRRTESPAAGDVRLRPNIGAARMHCSDFGIHFRLELRALADPGVLHVHPSDSVRHGGGNG